MTLRNGLSLSRRKLLRAGALATFVAPIVRQLDAVAQPMTSPKRLVLVFSPNGPMIAAGPASGSETSFTFHDWWRPLERHRDVGLFLSHMAIPGQGTVPGGGHGLGGSSFTGAGCLSTYDVNGPSIDQLIGRRLAMAGRAGLASSVVWGNQAHGFGLGEGFWRGARDWIMPELNPSSAFRQLFASFMAPPSGVDPVAQRRFDREKSVLDLTLRDCGVLRDALGAEGVRLLEGHCGSLRLLEEQLARPAATLQACTRPSDPAQTAAFWQNPQNQTLQTRAFWDLTTSAFACELTHVVAFQMGSVAARNQIPTSFGVPSAPVQNSGDSGPAHHPWTHNDRNANKETALRAFYRCYSEQVSLLVDGLKTTRDATGAPLIDSTLVIWMSELGGYPSNDDHHVTSGAPIVMFGGPRVLRGGRYVRGPATETLSGSGVTEAGRQAARILVSAWHHMGFTDVMNVGASNVSGPSSLL